MNLEAEIIRAVVDIVEAVLFHNPAVEDPRKVAYDLASERAHEIAIKAEIDRELKARKRAP